MSVAMENNESMIGPKQDAGSIQKMLTSGGVRVHLHGTTIFNASKRIDYEYDIDGVVIQLEDITAVKKNTCTTSFTLYQHSN